MLIILSSLCVGYSCKAATQVSTLEKAIITIKQVMVNYSLQIELDQATSVLKQIEGLYGLDYVNFKGSAYNSLFTCPEIVSCLHNLETTGSLDPLFSLWYSTYFFVSHFFLTEYAVLLFLTYRDLLRSFAFDSIEYRSETRTILFTELLEKTTFLYAKIESLPLQEILEMINLLANEIPKILENHTTESSMSWRSWIKENWWPISIALFTVFLKVLIIFKHKNTIILPHALHDFHPIGQPLQISPTQILRTAQKKITS